MAEGRGQIGPPEHLSPEHDLSGFDSGVRELDDWLKRRAAGNEASGASRTYVVQRDGRVVGYYSLATGAVELANAPGRVRRNMPDPIPVMVLARLTVDRSCQGSGLGKGLLRDAVLRMLQVAQLVGIRALLVHAISEDAKRFYERCGFMSSPIYPMTLMITVADAEKALAS